MDFSDRLKLLISETELTKDQFAAKSGKSRNQIFKYLRGETLPTADFFETIKKEFPWVNIEWLITGAGEMVSDSYRQQNAGSSQVATGDGNVQIGEVGNGHVKVSIPSKGVTLTAPKRGLVLIDEVELTLHEYVSKKIAKEIIKKLSK